MEIGKSAKAAAKPKIVKSVATAEDILGAPVIFVEVDAPELGAGKIIRVMQPDNDQYEQLESADWKFNPKTQRNEITAGRQIRWAVACVVNERNERILTLDQAEALGKKPGKLLERIFYAANRSHNISEATVEEEVKN